MRWMWIDRVVELVPRQRLVAVKHVSMAEERSKSQDRRKTRVRAPQFDVALLDFEDILIYLGGDRPARSVFTPARLDDDRRHHRAALAIADPPWCIIGEPVEEHRPADDADAARIEWIRSR